jgi:hypothetical protein
MYNGDVMLHLSISCVLSPEVFKSILDVIWYWVTLANVSGKFYYCLKVLLWTLYFSLLIMSASVM